jgi:hypothetical protein
MNPLLETMQKTVESKRTDKIPFTGTIYISKMLSDMVDKMGAVLGGEETKSLVMALMLESMVEEQFQQQVRAAMGLQSDAGSDPLSKAVGDIKERLKFDDLSKMASTLQQKMKSLETVLASMPQEENQNGTSVVNDSSSKKSGG